jgi:hypothetical protein
MLDVALACSSPLLDRVLTDVFATLPNVRVVSTTTPIVDFLVTATPTGVSEPAQRSVPLPVPRLAQLTLDRQANLIVRRDATREGAKPEILPGNLDVLLALVASSTEAKRPIAAIA